MSHPSHPSIQIERRASQLRLAPLLSVALIGALALAQPARAACDCTTLPTLGRAALYPALGIGDILVHFEGAALANTSTVAGNGGVTGAGGRVFIQGNAGLEGKVSHHTGSTVTCDPAGSCPAKIPGGIEEIDMSEVEADLLAASVAFAGMAPTQTFNGDLTKATSIGGNGCINVIQINGTVQLGGHRELTLTGTVDDYFVVNVTGDFLTEGNAEVVLNGIEPHQVIFNLTTPGARVELAGLSGGDFTILNPAGEVWLHGKDGGRGAYYAGQNKLHFQGDVDFFGEPFACGGPACPDPEFTGANIQIPATAQGRSLGNASFFNVFFDLDDFEGHIEHFRLDGAGVVRDEQGDPAIDPTTNQFEPTRDPYWDAAEGLRTNNARTVYTTLAGVRDDFTHANVTETDLDLQAGEVSAYPNAAALGITTTAQLKTAIIDHLYGIDAFDLDTDNNTAERRTAVLGSIFHSNTLMIGTPTSLLRGEPGFETFYGDHEQRERAVYAGANDGQLHSFDAGAWYNPLDPGQFNAGSGAENFAYIPGSLLDNVKLVPRIYDEDGNPIARFFVDGNLAAADAWLGDGTGTDLSKSADEWATVLLASFREGGEGYLALDVSDPNAGLASPHYPYPKFLWEFGHARMGNSWSRPVITRVKVEGAPGTGDHCGADDGDGDCREQWVAIFGAGYRADGDPNDKLAYETDPASLAWSDKSKAIFMVALDDGEVLGMVAFDSTGTNGPSGMKYSIPSPPGVFDIDGDKFADIVLIGDTGGRVWKWDINAVGDDTNADSMIDNWSAGTFFNSPPVLLSAGGFHYRSFYFPPVAAFVNGQLTYAFGTGERQDLLYAGDGAVDDNNRLYVIRDPNPVGASSIPATPYTEASLTDVSATGLDTNPADQGFFIVAQESEKYVTDWLVFAGYLIGASFVPDNSLSCGPGEAFLTTVKLSNGAGFFDNNATPEAADRKLAIGSGVPSPPRISVAPNPNDDVGFVNTSTGEVITFEPPLRTPPESSMIYWKQEF